MEPQDVVLAPGLTFVAPDGPYKGHQMTLIREDATKPGQDRWIIATDDKKEWGAPGARLREVLASQANGAPNETKAESDASSAPEEAPTQVEPALEAPPEGDSAPGAASDQAPTQAAVEQPAPPPLDFAHTPITLHIQLWEEEGNGRPAWVAVDLPDHSPLTTTLQGSQVAALLQPLVDLLAQLEAEFPKRQAKIVAALATQRASSAPPVRTTPAPAPRSKASGRALKGQPLTTAPAGAAQAAKPTAPSPELQAFPATLQQTKMFASPPAKEAASSAPTS